MKYLFISVLLFFLSGMGMNAEEVLSLEDCRRLALEHSKQLQIAQQKIEGAQYNRKSATANFLPEISFTGAYLYNERNLMLLDPAGLNPIIDVLLPRNLYTLDIHNIYVGALTLTQPIFMGGKIVAYHKITGYMEELAKSKKELTEQEVVVRTDEIYWQIVSLNYKKRLAENYLTLLKQLESNVQAMISDGVATRADGLTVTVKVNEAEVTLSKVANGISLSKMLLSQLCGMEVDKPYNLADEELLSSSKEEPILPINAEQALENRIELKSLDLAHQIYKKKEAIALSKMLPTVAAFGNYLATNPNMFKGIKHEFGGMWNVGVMVRVPIFHFGKNFYELKAARVETRVLELERDEAKEKIELQIKQAYFKINEAQHHLSMTTKNLEKANENLSHAQLGFKEGVMTATNVLEAQTAWLKAHSDNIDATIEEKLCRLYLLKAVGKLSY